LKTLSFSEVQNIFFIFSLFLTYFLPHQPGAEDDPFELPSTLELEFRPDELDRRLKPVPPEEAELSSERTDDSDLDLPQKLDLEDLGGLTTSSLGAEYLSPELLLFGVLKLAPEPLEFRPHQPEEDLGELTCGSGLKCLSFLGIYLFLFGL
jgi:hypothetical protein